MVDVAQLERTLDLWASMWHAHERALFERALERVVDGDGAEPLRLAALAACAVIATPRLLGAAERVAAELDDDTLEAVAAVVAPRRRLVGHAARLARDPSAVLFWLGKAVRDPDHPAADKLLDRVDIRDLYAVLQATDDDSLRTEAARRLARRGPHQRARLRQALDLEPEAFDEQLWVDVPLDDLLDGGAAAAV
jgi:hypothetical protein